MVRRPGGAVLLWSLSLLVALAPARAQSPAGGAKDAASPAPSRVSGRYDSIYASEDLSREAVAEPPAIPDAFRTRTETCFQAAALRQPGRSGRVDLQVTLADGVLREAAVVSNTLGDLLLTECLVARATGLGLAGLRDGSWTWGLVAGGTGAEGAP
jgi:hypothetical protein